MKKDVCYIVCAGEKRNMPTAVPKNCYVIAVDLGYQYLVQDGIQPDLVVGDFDSLGYTPQGTNVVQLPRHKDDTDTMFAIKQAISHGCTTFHIFCGTGGEFAHTFANIQCLAFIAQKSLIGILYDGDNKMTAVHNSCLKITNGHGNVSVFSLSSRSQGVNLQGLRYLLSDYTMTNAYPIGINNEFVGQDAIISVHCGTLLVILPSNAEINHQ